MKIRILESNYVSFLGLQYQNSIPGSLKQQKFIDSQFWRPAVQSESVGKTVFTPLKALGKELFDASLLVSGSLRWFLAYKCIFQSCVFT